MQAIADDEFLHALDFKVQDMREYFGQELADSTNNIINMVQKEIQAYFNKELTRFRVPLKFIGTNFQQKVWQALGNIAYGKTCSYKELALKVAAVNSARAVGNANGANRISIIVPCHRVIANDGSLGGYSAGLERKIWLLNHERAL